MTMTALEAVSPVDGRYRRTAAPLADYFSESALIKYRIRIEIEYFIALCKLPLPQLEGFDTTKDNDLRGVYDDFDLHSAQRVKEIEKTTNHDVKAVEYYIKEKFDQLGIGAYKEFIHFGLTSQDINNTAMPLALKEAWHAIMKPALQQLTGELSVKSQTWKNVPMLARTHGQPASPTRLGKELFVFVMRLTQQTQMLETVPYAAKFGGATGNLNALFAQRANLFKPWFWKFVFEIKRFLLRTREDYYQNRLKV